MGFLKRFFSIGSKKSKKSKRGRQMERNAELDHTGKLQPEHWQRAEGDATRLLRSSSAHYAVMSETDYTLLPPLPHPINNVVNSPAASPARSTLTTLTTLTSSGPGVQRSKSFTVTVHERKLEARTVFPNANPPISNNTPPAPKASTPTRTRSFSSASENSPPRRREPVTPREQGRLIRLRQDPSVASLLNMYDEKGRLSSTAFSNTPPTPDPIRHEVEAVREGRVQRKRTGSTLRQLLLGTEDSSGNDDGNFDADISWADRFLGEHEDADSSAPNTPLHTPRDILFADAPSEAAVTFMPGHSRDMPASNPLISSMEVEASAEAACREHSVDRPVTTVPNPTSPVEQKTPQRASEVFGFLTERRKSILARQKRQLEKASTDRPLPALPLSTPSENHRRDSNGGSDPCDTSASFAEIHTATRTKLTQISNPLLRSPSLPINTASEKSNARSSHSRASSVQIQRVTTGSSMVSSIASTSAASGSSNIPRGPRPVSTPGLSTVRTTTITPLTDVSLAKPQDPVTPHRSAASRISKYSDFVHEPLTPVRPQQRRITSNSSSVFSNDDREDGKSAVQKRSRKHERATERGKENSPMANRPTRTLFEQRYPNHVRGEPASPASSSDLSPIGKDMMMTLRKQRMRAREEMRYGSGSRSRRRLP